MLAGAGEGRLWNASVLLEVWWGHLGDLEEFAPTLLLLAFLQPLEGSRMYSQEPAAMLAALGHANLRHPASP